MLDSDGGHCLSKAHRALLKESRGEAPLVESYQGAHCVVAEDDGGVREVDKAICCLEGKDTGQGFAADLVEHVW